MEFAFDSHLPNYAGGLGVLAADTMYSCAEMGVNAIGVTLLYHQHDDSRTTLDATPFMKKTPHTVTVQIEDRQVAVSIWKMEIKGSGGHIVPVYFLSTYLPQNQRWDRDLTKYLYASDRYTRLGQETILGIGGIKALEKLGYENINCYHMNEGHSSLLTLELLRKYNGDVEKVRQKCTFTTHTPVAAGHDYFEYEMAKNTLKEVLPANIETFAGKQQFGMTQLAMALSRKTNSVSQKHRQICQRMFPGTPIENVTNGIYHLRWTGIEMYNLFEKYLPGWKKNPQILKNAPEKIPDEALLTARQKQKRKLIDWINSPNVPFPFNIAEKDDYFTADTLTIGFARRFVPYKRADLIFHFLDQLRETGYKKIQLIFATNRHPDDEYCKKVVDNIMLNARRMRGQIRIRVIPSYNLNIAQYLVSGCDVWLNNPLPPREASGTSGMKVALNGGINFSILDGWWIEALEQDPLSGWGFGGMEFPEEANRDDYDAGEIISTLKDIIDCYYNRQEEWQLRMKRSIALVHFFNTHRMTKEYKEKIWQKER